MKKYSFNSNRNSNRVPFFFFHAVVLLLLLTMAVGCAGGKNQGKLVLDRELDNTFTSYQVLPDHEYYITGSYASPSAILAIHKAYRLDNESNLWVPVPDADSDQMRIWIGNLDKYGGIKFWSGPEFMAAYILGPDNKRVGAWYSGQRYTRLEFFEENRIKVSPPDLKPSIGGERGTRESIRP